MDRRRYLACLSGAVCALAGCPTPATDDGDRSPRTGSPGEETPSTRAPTVTTTEGTTADPGSTTTEVTVSPSLGPVETVRQVVSGRPRRRTEVVLAANGSVTVADDAEVTVDVPVTRVDGTTVRSLVPVEGLEGDGNGLRVTLAGPVTEGTRFAVAANAVAIEGVPVPATEFRIEAAASHERGSLWFRPFVPRDGSLFPRDVYRGRPSVDRDPPTEETAVREELSTVLSRAVDAGGIDADRRSALSGRFDDPIARRACTDGATGRFRPRLLGAVLATAGTVGRFAIPTVLDGQTPSGNRPQFVVEDPQTGYRATVFPAPPGSGDAETVVLHPVLLDEPLPVLGALVAHECLHFAGGLPSTLTGKDEEIIAAAVEAVAYCQAVSVDPSLPTERSPLVRYSNALALALLNSGRDAYPTPGLHAAPHLEEEGVFPDGRRRLASFVAYVAGDYPVTPPIPSGGTGMLDSALSACLGQEVSGRGFTRNTVTLLDGGLSVLPPATALRVARALDCRLSVSEE